MLVGYVEDLGIPIRWVVITGDAEFFAITKRLHNQIAESLPAERKDVADTAIPALSMIEQMAVRRAPVAAFAPRSAAARAYAQLWAEVCERQS